MTPERWQQVKEIFDSAIKYLPEHRDRFLTQACANDKELRSEVESLITSHEKEGSFIDEPAYYAAAELLANEKSRSEEHTSELQSPCNLVCRLLLEKKKQ